MKKLIIAAAMCGASFVACAPAQSATLVSACSAAPLDIVGITAGNQTCAGYFAGQLLSGNAGDITDQKAALASLVFVPGDLVKLGMQARDGVIVHAEDVPIHHAKPGRSGARRAVQIVDPGKEEQL